MPRNILIAAMALGSANALAVNTATFNLDITSANGGTDSLVTWTLSGTPTMQIFSGYNSNTRTRYMLNFGAGSYDNSPYSVVTGPAYAAFNSPGVPALTGISTGLSITNTRTSESGNLTEFYTRSINGYPGTYKFGFDFTGVSANTNDGLALVPGDTFVISGPTSGSFLAGVAFSTFNEGQWITDSAAYLNFDPVLTIGGTPVPEPSTYGLALGGLALVGAVIRRRKASK